MSFRQLDTRSAVRAEVAARGVTEPSFETEEYFVALRYRRQFLRHWLYYEIRPEHAQPKDLDTGERRSDWRLTLTLEIQFENERSRRYPARRHLDEDEQSTFPEDDPIPVDAPGDRVEDPVLRDEDDEDRGGDADDGEG